MIFFSFDFLGNYSNGSTIKLGSNNLTAFDQSVFHPILQFFAAGGFDPTATFVDASSSKIFT